MSEESETAKWQQAEHRALIGMFKDEIHNLRQEIKEKDEAIVSLINREISYTAKTDCVIIANAEDTIEVRFGKKSGRGTYIAKTYTAKTDCVIVEKARFDQMKRDLAKYQGNNTEQLNEESETLVWRRMVDELRQQVYDLEREVDGLKGEIKEKNKAIQRLEIEKRELHGCCVKVSPNNLSDVAWEKIVDDYRQQVYHLKEKIKELEGAK